MKLDGNQDMLMAQNICFILVFFKLKVSSRKKNEIYLKARPPEWKKYLFSIMACTDKNKSESNMF